MSTSHFLAYLCLLLVSVNAVPSNFTLSSNTVGKPGQTVWTTKSQPNLACVGQVFGGFQSICDTGTWVYSTPGSTAIPVPSTESRCLDLTFKEVQSVSQVGPFNSSIESPSIFNLFSGKSVTILNSAEAYLNASGSSSYLFTSGTTSWTLFEGQRFQGNSVCIRSYKEVERFDNVRLASIGSVIRGCDTKHVKEVYEPAVEDAVIPFPII